jgi:FixJ family two-component response regulator
MSADKDEELNERVLKTGAVGYLQKPFGDRELVDLINIAVKERSSMDTTRKRKAPKSQKNMTGKKSIKGRISL